MLNEQMILADAAGLQAYVQMVYRDLHRHPEVAHQEIWTNQYLRQELDHYGIAYLAPAPNITIAIIDSGNPGAVVGLRCDTDALPVQEETGADFASLIPGKMHACGHDGHMAIGMGVARLLSHRKGEWQGRVKVIFQPAEEGEDGSDQVIATGLVNDVDVFFGLHLWSPFESGTLHAAPITVSAAVNMFQVRVTGKGGHGATPEKCADALVAGAEMISALQTIISRRLSPMEPGVLTIGSFHAGSVGNIIAQEAVFKGTIRTLNEETRKLAEDSLAEITGHIAAMHHCTVEIENIRVSDAVINDPRATEIALDCARKLAPADKICGQKTMMLGDNFANFGVIAPYCYVQVGIADEKKGTHFAHHNGHFAIDEDVLPLSVAWMAAACMRSGAEWRQNESEN